MFIKRVKVKENQRVLEYRDQKLVRVLTPGTYIYWYLQRKPEFVSFDLDDLYFAPKNAERLYQTCPQLAKYLKRWQLQGDQAGLLYENGLLRGVVAPGETLMVWKDAADTSLEPIDLNEALELDMALLNRVQRSGANSSTRLIRSDRTVAIKPVAEINVQKDHVGLLYVDGRYQHKLTPGLHGFWQFKHDIEVRSFDTRQQQLEISGQEILSKDRVSLRLNLSANIRITDVELAAQQLERVDEYVYKTLQLALREAVGTKTLDDLLLDKLYINETVRELVSDTLERVGVRLLNVGVKDIILPGEMKAILNQVVEAQKAAEANVIKRREETAATRSLHNTAKVMENNPTLVRLKELEALEKMAEKIDSLTVYGGLEGLMNGVVKIT